MEAIKSKHWYVDNRECSPLDLRTRQATREITLNKQSHFNHPLWSTLISGGNISILHGTKQITRWIRPDGGTNGVEWSVGIACCARNVCLCRYVQLSNFSAARATSIDIIARRRDPHTPPHWAFKCPYRCMTHHAATTKALTAGHATFRTSLVKAWRTPASCR